MTEVVNNIVDEKPKKVNKTADKRKYFKDYMVAYREQNKEKIERMRIVATCTRKHTMPSNRAMKIHNFTKDELNFFLLNCRINN